MVSSRDQRGISLAIRNYNERQLFSLQSFLKQHSLSPDSHFVLIHHSMDKIFRRTRILRDKNTLPRAPTIRLYHHRPLQPRNRTDGVLRTFKRAIHLCSWNIVALQKLLGEDLAPLQLRGLLGRGHNRPTAAAECVTDAVHQRQFWPDDGEIRLEPFC